MLAKMTAHPHFLRRVLALDALSCAACALPQLLLNQSMARWLGLPSVLLSGTGLFLLVYSAVVGFLASRAAPPRPLVWLLVAGNLVWAVDCLLLLASGWVSPTALGTAYVLVQAMTVLLLADLQWLGLRGARATALNPAGNPG
jgi:hypothetical protein